MQEYDDASRGLNGSLLFPCKQPQSCFPASPFTIRHTDGMQGARVARDCEYTSDYYFGSFAQQTLQIPMQQYNLTLSGSIERSLQYRASQIQEDLSMLPCHISPSNSGLGCMATRFGRVLKLSRCRG